MPTAEGHVFISYVHEDKARVDRLQNILEAAGIVVWRDTQELWPGEDWRHRIRAAITRGALAFLACFSEHTAARSKSYQNAELSLAVDEIRLRPPGTPWLIPVRFDPVELPYYDLGGGRSLDNLQRVDLTGEDWAAPSARLVTSLVRILAVSNTQPGRPERAVQMLSGRDYVSRPSSLQEFGSGPAPSTPDARPVLPRSMTIPSSPLQPRQLKALAIDGGVAMAVAQLSVAFQVLAGRAYQDALDYLLIAFALAYVGIGTLSHRLLGGTIGQRRAKLEVVDSDGQPIASTTACLRSFILHFDGVGTSRTRCIEATGREPSAATSLAVTALNRSAD